jgi:hypothetical protein
MKKAAVFLAFFFACLSVSAQKQKTIRIPLTAEKWTFEPQKVEFIYENEVQAMKILPQMGMVMLKDFNFSSGTIEFDIKPLAQAFTSFYFRVKDAKENECFYFRNGQAGNPAAIDAVQYTPVVAGVNLWDMLGHYQSNASFKKEEWNHVKLIISGAQMRVYVNSQTQPTLEIPRLEGNTTEGTMAFQGEALISNLVVKPMETEGLSPLPGIDPTHNDPRYIQNWAVSEPMVTPKNVDFSQDFLPKQETAWQVIAAERRGLINLTRQFGKSESRRFAWLKVKINSDTDQAKKLALGFSDEVWVYLNGKMVYVDKNLYAQPIMKEPDGRCSIENTSFSLPLTKGHNELLIGLANDFFGWGIIARMEDLKGIQVAPDPTFDYRIVKIAENLLATYAGTYIQPDGRRITITKANNAISISGEGIPPVTLYPESENKFFMREFDVQIEFLKDEPGKGLKYILYQSGKKVADAKKAD